MLLGRLCRLEGSGEMLERNLAAMTDHAVPGAEDVVASARSLARLLAEHASEAEELRRPTDEVIAALRDARIFDLMVPVSHGGLGLDLDAFVAVGLELARGDASMGWVANFYIEHNWMLCNFPSTFQAALYRDRTHILAPAAISVSGEATPAVSDGVEGYALDGRWHWGTGSHHAEWMIVGSIVDHGDDPTWAGQLDLRMFALPADEVAIDDVWFTSGMAATGSNDLVVDAAFVPEERTASIVEMSDGTAAGAALHGAAQPLYRTPMLPILSLATAMPAVGQALAAVEAFAQQMQQRVLFGSFEQQKDKPAAQIRLARAEIEAADAAAMLRDVAAEAMLLRNDATKQDRARMTARCALAVEGAKRVIGSVVEASGASAQFNHHPLQRSLRDVTTLSCHMVLDVDARLELLGKFMLGQEPPGMV